MCRRLFVGCVGGWDGVRQTINFFWDGVRRFFVVLVVCVVDAVVGRVDGLPKGAVVGLGLALGLALGLGGGAREVEADCWRVVGWGVAGWGEGFAVDKVVSWRAVATDAELAGWDIVPRIMATCVDKCTFVNETKLQCKKGTRDRDASCLSCKVLSA